MEKCNKIGTNDLGALSHYLIPYFHFEWFCEPGQSLILKMAVALKNYIHHILSMIVVWLLGITVYVTDHEVLFQLSLC